MGLGKTYSTKYLLDSNNNSGVAGQVLSTTSTGIDWVDANTLPGAGLWLDNGNDIYNSNSGNVGIGAAIPSQKLEVVGNIQATGTSSISSSFDANHYMRIESNSSGGILKGADGGVITTLVRTYGDSYFNSGNVGIGTTNPGAKLHVKGDKTYSLGYLDKTSDLHIGNDTMSSAVGAYAGSITFGSTNESNLQAASIVAIQTDTDSNEIGLAFFTQHSPAGSTDLVESMRIKNDGNVGIGTTSPSNKLSLAGSGQNWATSPAIKMWDSYNSKGWYVGSANNATIGDFYIRSVTAEGAYPVSADQQFTIKQSGNVGIGMTSPGALLQVGGIIDSNASYGSFNVGGAFGAGSWTRSYTVSNTNILSILQADNTALQNGGAYRVTGHINSTGTDNSSRAVFWNQNGTWFCNVTSASGASSNNILFLVDATTGLPSVKTYHANDYAVNVWHERIILNEGTGTDNSRHYFGADAYMTQIGNDISMFTSTYSGNNTAGNLGIGTETPQQLLHVYKSDAPAGIEIQGGLDTITAIGDVQAFIDFGTNDQSATGQIAGRIESLSEIANGAHNGLAFYTGQQSRTPYLQKAMQIRNTGAISFGSGSAAHGNSGQILKSNADASPTWVDASTVIGGPYLPLSAGGSYPLTGELIINSSGVKVQGAATDQYFIQGFRTGNSGNTFSVYDNGSTAYINSYQTMSFRANQHGGTGGHFTFTNGNVVIGTTSPDAKLNIKGSVSTALTGTVSVTIATTAVVGVGTLFTTELEVGDAIKIGTEIFAVATITDALNLTIDSAHAAGASAVTAYSDSTLFNVDNGNDVNLLTVDKSGSATFGSSVSATDGNFSGDVGIGTATPDQKLHIKGGDIQTQDTTGSNGVLRIRATITGTPSTGGYPNVGAGDAVIEGGGTTQRQPGVITLMNGDSSISSGQDLGVIQFVGKDDQANGYCTSQIISTTSGSMGSGASGGGILRFLTSPGNTGSPVEERMRITNTGNVGIRATNPFWDLDVAGHIRIRDQGRLYFGDSGSIPELEIYSDSSKNMVIGDVYLNTADVLFNIQGNVGIGATSPSAKLDVKETTSDVAGEIIVGGLIASDNVPFGKISFANTATANTQTNDVLASIAGEKVGSSNRGELTFLTSDSAAPVERMRIASDGNVTMTGDVSANNLSGTNTGDQDLTGYALTSVSDGKYLLNTTDTLTGNLTLTTPDTGTSPAMTNTTRLKGYEGRGIGIKIQDSVNSATSPSDREWFIGSGYNQSGFNIGYAANGVQSSYTAQNKFALTTAGNGVFAGTVTGSNLSGTNTGDQTLPTAASLGAVTIAGSQTISGNKTFTGTTNVYNGHHYYSSYDSAGNHYPHFDDGADASGTTINWRQYYGTSLKTHTWTSDSLGNMVFTFQGDINANGGDVTGSNLSGTNTGDQDLTGYATTSALGSYLPLAGGTIASAGVYSGELKFENNAQTVGIDYQNNGKLRLIDRSNSRESINFNLLDGSIEAKNAANVTTNLLSTDSDSYLNGGDLGIGTTSPNTKLDLISGMNNGIRISATDTTNNWRDINIRSYVSQSEADALPEGIAIFTTNPSSQSDPAFSKYGGTVIQCRDSGNSSFAIRIGAGSGYQTALFINNTAAATFSSTVTATNFQLSSDKRLKNNIKEIDTKHIGVNWKNFELKSEPGVKRSGVIAQELEEKHPEFVRTDDQGMKSVAYIDLLIAKIAELEARLEKAGI